MMRTAILAAIPLLCAACSTPYQASGWTGGYQDERLDPNTWRVSFLGNANRDAAFVMNSAMYRAAEIAKREGYPYFQVILASTTVASRAYVNFTNLVAYRAELTTNGVKSVEEGCPKGPVLGCKVYATEEALRDYGGLIGISPTR